MGSCGLHVAGFNIMMDCQQGSLFLPLNRGANAAPASVQALMLAMLEPELQAIVFSIRSHTWDRATPMPYHPTLRHHLHIGHQWTVLFLSYYNIT